MTLKIKKRTDGELYAHDENTNTVYSFDGTPYEAPEAAQDWVVVAEVPHLFAWQEDPGRYHPAYLYGAMVPNDDCREMFIFGGSFLYAMTWAREHDAHVGSVFRHMYDDRNFVRRLAELRGGVAW